ncbi:MAG: hypothetical protein ABEJ68_04075 [Halobacteriaceae archaeon]
MSDASRPGDTMRERVPDGRVKLWLLLGASRISVVAVLLGVIFVVVVGVGVLRPGFPTGGDPIETLGQAYVTAIITGVTLVVTISQVVLSQELGAVGDQRERMAEATAFRSDVADAVDAPVAPPEPSAFLRALVEATADRATTLREAVDDAEDERLRTRATDYAESIGENADSVGAALDGAQFGTFAVLYAALDFNYSWKIYEGRRLRHEHADAMPAEAEDALDGLVETLEFFGPAREHFKTLYFQWELINLSRVMLYAAAPALLVAASMVLFLDGVTVVGRTAGVSNLLWVVAGASAVASLPFAVFGAYVLRILTVAKRTLAIGPFVLRATQRTDDIDWE